MGQKLVGAGALGDTTPKNIKKKKAGKIVEEIDMEKRKQEE